MVDFDDQRLRVCESVCVCINDLVFHNFCHISIDKNFCYHVNMGWMFDLCEIQWYLLRVMVRGEGRVIALLNLLTQSQQVHLVPIKRTLQCRHLHMVNRQHTVTENTLLNFIFILHQSLWAVQLKTSILRSEKPFSFYFRNSPILNWPHVAAFLCLLVITAEAPNQTFPCLICF